MISLPQSRNAAYKPAQLLKPRVLWLRMRHLPMLGCLPGTGHHREQRSICQHAGTPTNLTLSTLKRCTQRRSTTTAPNVSTSRRSTKPGQPKARAPQQPGHWINGTELIKHLSDFAVLRFVRSRSLLARSGLAARSTAPPLRPAFEHRYGRLCSVLRLVAKNVPEKRIPGQRAI
jgi:hypothetical protein